MWRPPCLRRRKGTDQLDPYDHWKRSDTKPTDVRFLDRAVEIGDTNATSTEGWFSTDVGRNGWWTLQPLFRERAAAIGSRGCRDRGVPRSNLVLPLPRG